MEITGTLLHLLTPQTGTGKNGQWKKQDFVIETGDTYPKKILHFNMGRQNRSK
jgi:hypothetical protein